MSGEVVRIYSLNLIAWLRCHGVNVHVYCQDDRIFGVYKETNNTVLIRQLYNENEELHKFLNEFKHLKQLKHLENQ